MRLAFSQTGGVGSQSDRWGWQSVIYVKFAVRHVSGVGSQIGGVGSQRDAVGSQTGEVGSQSDG